MKVYTSAVAAVVATAALCATVDAAPTQDIGITGAGQIAVIPSDYRVGGISRSERRSTITNQLAVTALTLTFNNLRADWAKENELENPRSFVVFCKAWAMQKPKEWANIVKSRAIGRLVNSSDAMSTFLPKFVVGLLPAVENLMKGFLGARKENGTTFREYAEKWLETQVNEYLDIGVEWLTEVVEYVNDSNFGLSDEDATMADVDVTALGKEFAMSFIKELASKGTFNISVKELAKEFILKNKKGFTLVIMKATTSTLVSAVDTNRDGKFTVDDIIGRFDANKDGKIDYDDIKTFFKNRKSRIQAALPRLKKPHRDEFSEFLDAVPSLDDLEPSVQVTPDELRELERFNPSVIEGETFYDAREFDAREF